MLLAGSGVARTSDGIGTLVRRGRLLCRKAAIPPPTTRPASAAHGESRDAKAVATKARPPVTSCQSLGCPPTSRRTWRSDAPGRRLRATSNATHATASSKSTPKTTPTPRTVGREVRSRWDLTTVAIRR